MQKINTISYTVVAKIWTPTRVSKFWGKLENKVGRSCCLCKGKAVAGGAESLREH